MRTKEKISISLDRIIIDKVDSMIDKKRIRNRSQAIEHILREYFETGKINSALILAGGGKKAYKNGILKTLHVYRRKPLICHIVDRLLDAGISPIYVSTSDEMAVKRACRDVRTIEDEKIGTAGIVKKFIKENGRSIVISGDVYFELDLKRMINFHVHAGKMCTMLVTTTNREKSKDAVEIEGNDIVRFSYKPKNRTYLVNAGVFIFEPESVNMIPPRGSLETHVFPRLAKSRELAGFHFSGKWFHLD